jgi:ABC-2 type transport system permease protein
MSRVVVLLRHDLLALRREPTALITLLFTPCLLLLFIKPLYAAVLPRLGYANGSGAELAVPAMTVMFSFFTAGIVSESIFREHGLNTWERLRGSPLRLWEIILAKVIPGVVLVVLQAGVLFAIGVLLLGLRIRGDVVALFFVVLSLGACVGTFAVALCAMSSSRRQSFAIERMVTLSWTVFGGALVPWELMPGWIARIGRLTPVHWAVTGMREVVLDGGGWAAVLPSIVALGAFTAIFVIIAGWQFDVSKQREHWH